MKMKPTRVTPVMIALALFLTLPCSYAKEQTLASFAFSDTIRNPGEEGPYLRLNEIHSRAARHFIKKFPEIAGEKWLRLEGGYLAKFIDKGIKTNAYYDDQGRFIASTKCYDGLMLPNHIKTDIATEFPGYCIMLATEIDNGEEQFYRVYIKNSESYKTLQVYQSNIEVLQALKTCESRENLPL